MPRRTLLRLLRVSAELVPRGEDDLLLQLYSDRLFGEGVGPELELIRAYAWRGSLDTALEVCPHLPTPPYTSVHLPTPPHISLEVYRLCSAAASPVLGELRAARRRPHAAQGAQGAQGPEGPQGPSEGAQLLEAALRACVEAGELRTALRLFRPAAGGGAGGGGGFGVEGLRREWS